MQWQDLKARAARAFTFAWARRTKIAGYLGIIGGSVEMAITEQQHIGMVLLGACVAAIGHYNDLEQARREAQ